MMFVIRKLYEYLVLEIITFSQFDIKQRYYADFIFDI